MIASEHTAYKQTQLIAVYIRVGDQSTDINKHGTHKCLVNNKNFRCRNTARILAIFGQNLVQLKHNNYCNVLVIKLTHTYH